MLLSMKARCCSFSIFADASEQYKRKRIALARTSFARMKTEAHTHKMTRTQAPRRGAYSSSSSQYGGRTTIFRGRALQRGHGLGRLFSTLFRVAVPVIRRAAPIARKVAVQAGKKLAKTAFKRAKKAGVKALSDVVSKRATVKKAVTQRAQEAALEAAMDAINKGKSPQKANTPARRRASTVRRKKNKRNTAPRL